MWAKLPDDFPQMPHLLNLGRDTAAGVLLYVAGACYSARFLTDGMIPRAAVPTLAYIEGVDNFTIADKLVLAEMWERTDTGYRDCWYLAWNVSKETYEGWKAAGKRGALSRWGKRQQRQPQSESDGLPHSDSECQSSYPSPSPSSVPEVESVLDQEALIAAFLQRFPGQRELDVRTKIGLAWGEDGAEETAEAVRRTLAGATRGPLTYFEKAIASVKAGD